MHNICILCIRISTASRLHFSWNGNSSENTYNQVAQLLWIIRDPVLLGQLLIALSYSGMQFVNFVFIPAV